MLEAGALLGDRYRVGRTLGKGGMGVVLEATHLQLGTQVAIKVLKRDSADAANVERFMREARAAAKLRGEHICRVHDVGALPDGAPYMVMELLEGQDLATVLKAAGPIAEDLLARYMVEVCAAIAEAHAAGIIHRDLKPGNLYVVDRPDGGQVMKVLDFGIAKSLEKKDFALTDTTNVMGSPVYMSPEQLKSSRNVDTRSDIWSLGVVMFEMLTGKHPFTGETLTELAIAIANEPLPAFDSRVSAAFGAVIVKCLEKDAAKRYQDVADLAAALEPLAKRASSAAGAIKRTLKTGSVPAISIPDGPTTERELPSNLAGPDVTAKLAEGKPLVRAISEVADAKETTTLRGASGAVLAQTGERPRPRWLMPAIGAAVAAVAIFIGVSALGGGGGDDDHAQPAAQPAPEPAPPPPPPVEAKPPHVEAPAVVETPAAAVETPPVVEPETPPTKPAAKTGKSTKTTKTTKGTKTTKPADLSGSRY